MRNILRRPPPNLSARTSRVSRPVQSKWNLKTCRNVCVSFERIYSSRNIFFVFFFILFYFFSFFGTKARSLSLSLSLFWWKKFYKFIKSWEKFATFHHRSQRFLFPCFFSLVFSFFLFIRSNGLAVDESEIKSREIFPPERFKIVCKTSVKIARPF